jgi:lysophospholipase L1-like esterase
MLMSALIACSATVPGITKLPDDATILAFGDSLTYGTGAKPGQGYPAALERLTGRRVINAGVPGEITQQGLERLPGLLDQHQPQLLILCHGGNDMLRKKGLDAAADNLRQMIRLARERDIPVVLIGVPKPGLFLSTAEFYGQIAAEFQLPFEDAILADIESDRALKADAIHPNGAGYQKFADAIYRLLQQTGAV